MTLPTLFLQDVGGDELFLWYGWPTKGILSYFLAGTIVRDTHHWKSLRRRKQDLDLRKTWVQA